MVQTEALRLYIRQETDIKRSVAEDIVIFHHRIYGAYNKDVLNNEWWFSREDYNYT